MLKTLGMTPAQVLAMVASTALVLGIVGGVLGLPAGVAVHRGLMRCSTPNDHGGFVGRRRRQPLGSI